MKDKTMSNAGASLATCYGPVSTQMMAKAENIRLLIPTWMAYFPMA